MDLSEELVEVVDAEDVSQEVKPLRECISWGLLHRSVAVLVFDSSGRLLLQKRSASKPWRPGYWTLSSTGHVRAGESYGDAAARELQEELGVSCSLRFISKFLAPKFRQGDLTEWEFVAIFDGRHDGPVVPDGVEVDECASLTPAELLGMAKDPEEMLSPDAIAVINEYRRVSGRF